MRWVIAIALLLSPLLLQPAAALARVSSSDMPAYGGLPAMCGDASQTVLFSSGGPALGSARQGSMPVSIQVSLQVPVTSAADAAAALPRDHDDADAQTAWCISPDDPRCAPRDAGAPLHTQRGLLQLCDFASLRTPEPACTETNAVALLARLCAPRAGVSLRLERPPRA